MSRLMLVVLLCSLLLSRAGRGGEGKSTEYGGGSGSSSSRQYKGKGKGETQHATNANTQYGGASSSTDPGKGKGKTQPSTNTQYGGLALARPLRARAKGATKAPKLKRRDVNEIVRLSHWFQTVGCGSWRNSCKS